MHDTLTIGDVPTWSARSALLEVLALWGSGDCGGLGVLAFDRLTRLLTWPALWEFAIAALHHMSLSGAGNEHDDTDGTHHFTRPVKGKANMVRGNPELLFEIRLDASTVLSGTLHVWPFRIRVYLY